MNSDKLNSKYFKILMHLLNQLEKRIVLFRMSLYGDNEFSDGILSKKKLEMKNDEFENTSINDYRQIADSCEIEKYIRRILYEMSSMKTYESLKEIILELESESTAFNKHKKMIEAKKRQIDQLKEDLPALTEQTQMAVQNLKRGKLQVKEASGERADVFKETDFLKQLMDYKIESRKNYYKQKFSELRENTEWFERETRTQGHADVQTISFWLLKYDDYSEKLDMLLKQTFDCWVAKRRDLEILKKYRKINLERIQKLHKLILEREDYIEKDRIQKEIEQKEREDLLKKEAAATILQAYWRGTMVRKHLGPYKVKKAKKGKGKGKKGKGKKK